MPSHESLVGWGGVGWRVEEGVGRVQSRMQDTSLHLELGHSVSLVVESAFQKSSVSHSVSVCMA